MALLYNDPRPIGLLEPDTLRLVHPQLLPTPPGPTGIPLLDVLRTDPGVREAGLQQMKNAVQYGPFANMQPGVPLEQQLSERMVDAVMPFGMTLWHGSRHLFDALPGNPMGMFNASKMSTGAGDQWFGHGFYLAQAPGVSQTYRMMGSPFAPEFWNYKGKNIRQYSAPTSLGEATIEDLAVARVASLSDNSVNPVNLALYDIGDDLRMSKREFDLGKERGEIRDRDLKSFKARLEAEAAFLRKHQSDFTPSGKNAGYLYEVDFPDDAKLLEWDEPISKQGIKITTPAVQQAIREQAKEWLEVAGPVKARRLREVIKDPNKATGEDLYRGIQYHFIQQGMGAKDAEIRASEFLRQKGFAGHKFLDQFSRRKAKRDVGLLKTLQKDLVKAQREFDVAEKNLERFGASMETGGAYGDALSKVVRIQEQIDEQMTRPLNPKHTHNVVVYPGAESLLKIQTVHR